MARQFVETALQRLESMQVSAKPTASGDVRQQVVVVPMNIDGAWNDVVMKFVRAEGGNGNKNDRKNIFVTMSVAPSALGEIAASFDFSGANHCSLRMEFDKNRTLSWFETNRQGLTDAFANLGFTNMKIDFKASAPQDGRTRGAPPSAPDGVIDIVI